MSSVISNGSVCNSLNFLIQSVITATRARISPPIRLRTRKDKKKVTKNKEPVESLNPCANPNKEIIEEILPKFEIVSNNQSLLNKR
jgi:hypothetical protein